MATPDSLPILIVGAGICGLLFAQRLHTLKIPFLVFERDASFATRGLGWGLTLHWSLPALRQLLPDHLLERLSTIYVDREAVAAGAGSTFPFYDLSTGKEAGRSPRAGPDQRIRVTRENLRKLLAEDIKVQWSKAFRTFQISEDTTSVTAIFDDGSTVKGRALIGCDGAHSRVRRALYPDSYANYQIPVKMLGFTMRVTKEQAKPIQELDRFFLQGTASNSDAFMYISLLEAPKDAQARVRPETGSYLYQICISWNTLKPPFEDVVFEDPATPTNEERMNLIKKLARSWEEPFRSFVSLLPDTADIKPLDLDDFTPRTGLRFNERVILLGDALHAMAMYRGEGANHAIVDVLNLQEKLLPWLQHSDGTINHGPELSAFADETIARTRAAVLASRRACLDAHNWHGLTAQSPLLTKREMILDYDEDKVGAE